MSTLIADSEVPVPKVPLTCCYNSTVADALVGLLRRLYTFPKWTALITRQLLCGTGNSYAASLAFVGGITNKPRIGGDIVTQDGRHGKLAFNLNNEFKNRLYFVSIVFSSLILVCEFRCRYVHSSQWTAACPIATSGRSHFRSVGNCSSYTKSDGDAPNASHT